MSRSVSWPGKHENSSASVFPVTLDKMGHMNSRHKCLLNKHRNQTKICTYSSCYTWGQNIIYVTGPHGLHQTYIWCRWQLQMGTLLEHVTHPSASRKPSQFHQAVKELKAHGQAVYLAMQLPFEREILYHCRLAYRSGGIIQRPCLSVSM